MRFNFPVLSAVLTALAVSTFLSAGLAHAGELDSEAQVTNETKALARDLPQTLIVRTNAATGEVQTMHVHARLPADMTATALVTNGAFTKAVKACNPQANSIAIARSHLGTSVGTAAVSEAVGATRTTITAVITSPTTTTTATTGAAGTTAITAGTGAGTKPYFIHDDSFTTIHSRRLIHDDEWAGIYKCRHFF